MGLLDDAIREHLDLKRRRGADPSEIAKEEADALGPVRREAADEELIDDVAPAVHGSSADHEPAVAYDDEPLEFEDEPLAYDDEPVVSEPPTTHDRPYAEPEEESATPPHGDPLAHQPTREFSATELDEALGQEEDPPPPSAPAAGEADDEEEDVLEETPDFLQETPEHDRLWFEQKPPKDFDF
ncbi:MAG: hypothetical protein ABW167_04535 [Baekduia sp.]